MKKENKLKLAGALLGATLITATAGVAAETKKDMSKSEAMMAQGEDANMTSEAMMKKKKQMQEHAKAADAKRTTQKWG